MLEALPVIVLFSALGLLAGLFFPAVIGYSILFFRREGLHFKTAFRWVVRILLGFLVFGMVAGALVGIGESLGFADEESLNSDPALVAYMVTTNLGLWGGLLGLWIGRRRGRPRSHSGSEAPA